ncbi:unnamed protein product [Cochlearia groenlandica]
MCGPRWVGGGKSTRESAGTPPAETSGIGSSIGFLLMFGSGGGSGGGSIGLGWNLILDLRPREILLEVGSTVGDYQVRIAMFRISRLLNSLTDWLLELADRLISQPCGGKRLALGFSWYYPGFSPIVKSWVEPLYG